jgi:predicted alpha/beta hydrolase
MTADTSPVSFTAQDGRELSGLLVSAATPRGALVINGAVGFPREFYLKFARYAAQRGYHVLVYDYRGMGASRREPLRDDPAQLLDWGRQDIPAAFAWLVANFRELPLFTLGHSIGGQFVGFLPNPERARAHVMIAVSIAYWRGEHFPFRYLALFFWKLYGPWLLLRHGYVRQSRLWTGLSLPRAVFEQWRVWGLNLEHFVPDLSDEERSSRFGAFPGPALAYAFEDDPIATRRNVPPLLALYRQAAIEERWIDPKAIGSRRIGHQGFFHERHRDSLWLPVLDWLDARC